MMTAWRATASIQAVYAVPDPGNMFPDSQVHYIDVCGLEKHCLLLAQNLLEVRCHRIEGVNVVEQAEKDKLRILLDYWVKHNREHSGEFREWAEKAREAGEPDMGSDIMEAVENMDRVDASLLRALGRLA
jgi:hypothetical protein